VGFSEHKIEAAAQKQARGGMQTAAAEDWHPPLAADSLQAGWLEFGQKATCEFRSTGHGLLIFEHIQAIITAWAARRAGPHLTIARAPGRVYTWGFFGPDRIRNALLPMAPFSVVYSCL